MKVAKLRPRAQHIENECIRIDNLTGLPVQDQNCILCSLKEAAVLEFAFHKRIFNPPVFDGLRFAEVRQLAETSAYSMRIGGL